MKVLASIAIACALAACGTAETPPPATSHGAPCGLTPEEQAAPIAPSANYVAPPPSVDAGSTD
jgi:hypothetical protein